MNKRRLIFFSTVFSLVFSTTELNSNGIFSSEFLQNEAVSVVSNVDEKWVFPVGKSIGVTLSTDGVMVVSVAEMETEDGGREAPARDAGIKSGDMIKAFNGVKISNVDDLNSAVDSSDGKSSSVTIKRDNKTIETLVCPKISKEDGKLKIGAWVKDAASGIGTMTFYDPENGSFAALGHGICDPETGSIISVDSGNILSSTIVSVQKGERGVPGELKGVFSENKCVLGAIEKNSVCGIFGTADEDLSYGCEPVAIATKNHVHTGSAYVIANVEGNKIESFDIEIQRVMPQLTSTSKGMVIKITDRRLIEKTGGIVQGMSGSPIIQNGKLVGAVTHVFVNDPTRGYGIFIENMLAEAEKIK